MNTKILFCILLLQCIITNAIAHVPSDTILYEGKSSDSAPKYFIKDGIYYKWQWDKKQKEYMLYRDTIPLVIKTKDFDISSYFFDEHNQVIYYGNDYVYYNFDFKRDTLTTVIPSQKEENFVMADNKLYFSNNQILHIQNLITEKIIDLSNIGEMVRNSDDEILRIIKFSTTHEFLFMTGSFDAGEIADEQYYIYDEINKKHSLSKNNIILKNTLDPNAVVLLYDLSGKYVFLHGYILDSNYNFFSKINAFSASIYGLIFTQKGIGQLIVKSKLDLKDGEKENNQVLIPFVPDPFKEKAMYEIYKNIELKALDLQRFDAFDLRILRNMIFAKHNYAFKDKFLQAYFNLYNFYSFSNANRLTDVNHLLTPEDKKNLELIQQVSKQKENAK
jgi:hypothetical protein